MKPNTIFPVFCAWAILATASIAYAQAPTAYKPGDVLSFKVRFDGEGIDKLVSAQVTLSLSSPIREDQKPFNTQINANGSRGSEPGVFETSLTISDYIASGTYTIRQISTGTQTFGFLYRDDLPDITIRIDNPHHFEQPKLKSVEKTSHP